MKNIFYTFLNVLIGLYFLSVTVAASFYNWEYAKENGFISWLFMGEIVPTLKAVAWPYFVITKKEPSQKSGQTAAEFSVGEMSSYSKVLSAMQNHSLTDADLDTVRYVMSHYTKRVGKQISKEELNTLVMSVRIPSDYQNQLGMCVLFSWDRKKYTTTDDFNNLYKQLKSSGLRKESKLKADLETLKAAAANRPYLEDELGQKYVFNRGIILLSMKQNQLVRSNFDQFAKVVGEFAE